MEEQRKIIVEKHSDGYVAYPIGLAGVAVGQGDTHQEALNDVRSAIDFHVQTFGEKKNAGDPPVIETFRRSKRGTSTPRSTNDDTPSQP